MEAEMTDTATATATATKWTFQSLGLSTLFLGKSGAEGADPVGTVQVKSGHLHVDRAKSNDPSEPHPDDVPTDKEDPFSFLPNGAIRLNLNWARDEDTEKVATLGELLVAEEYLKAYDLAATFAS
jgi:hypothetical protein